MKNFTICILAVSITILTGACNKFVDINPPNTKLISNTAFQSDATANSAAMGIYYSMNKQSASPFSMSFLTGLSADELKSYSTNVTLLQVYTNAILPLDAQTINIWSGGYNCIFQANSVIEGAGGSSTLSAPVKKQIIAEAHFLRAFWHFYLVNLFGNIPVVTTTDYNVNNKLVRLSASEVYKQIVIDLQNAQENLNPEYVDGTSVNITTERVKANRNAATALLARVFLFMQRYADAEQQASKIIDQATVYSLEAPEKVFLMESQEAILQLMMPLPATSNTTEGTGFILTSRPSTGTNRSATLSASLFDSFEMGDLRKINWVGSTTNNGTTYYYPAKYKIASGGTDIKEHSILLRLGEQYLIRAEARAHLNNLSGSIADLDVIRKRAGLPLIADTLPSIGKDDLVNAIIKERRVELFAEWGHRWLDLKRTGKIDAVMTAEAPAKGSSWSNYKQYYPIPQKDLENNKNLVQNDGYPK